MIDIFNKIKQSIGILQHPEEAVWAAKNTLEHLGKFADIFVEFGSFTGGNFVFYATTIGDTEGLFIAVDPQTHGATFQSDLVAAAIPRGHVFISEDSISCSDSLLLTLGGCKIDVVHIDSVHLASHTEREWAILKPLMNSPSVVIVHDIKPGWRQSDYSGYLGQDIRQLSTGDWFQRIKFDYSYMEKKVDGPHPDMGIGLLLL